MSQAPFRFQSERALSYLEEMQMISWLCQPLTESQHLELLQLELQEQHKRRLQANCVASTT